MADAARRSGPEIFTWLSSTIVVVLCAAVLALSGSVLFSGEPLRQDDLLLAVSFGGSASVLAGLSATTMLLVATRAAIARAFAVACAISTLLHHGAIVAFLAIDGLDLWQPSTDAMGDIFLMPFLVAIEAGMAVVGLVALAIGLLHAASLISFARAP